MEGVAVELMNGLAQHDGRAFGVHMLFKHLNFSAHPSVTHHGIQRREQLNNEAVDPQAGHGLVQMASQAINVMAAQQPHGLIQQLAYTPFATGQVHGARQQGFGDALQLLDRQCHNLARAVASVQKTLDDAKFFHLRQGVAAFAKAVSPWLWETIAALPHPERILADTRVPLDSSYRKLKVFRLAYAQIHRVIFIKKYCQTNMS